VRDRVRGLLELLLRSVPLLRLPPTLALLIANSVPLIGVLFLGWSLGQLMIVYWAESGIIGFFNVLKLALVARLRALWIAPLFALHFGMFMAVHLVFVLVLFVDARSVQALTRERLYLALIPLFASHALSFVTYFVRGREYRRVSWQEQMLAPYGRVVVMHLTILATAAILVVLRSVPVAGVTALVLVKTLADFASHAAEHGRRQLAARRARPV
jgi:hypothetical protein